MGKDGRIVSVGPIAPHILQGWIDSLIRYEGERLVVGFFRTCRAQQYRSKETVVSSEKKMRDARPIQEDFELSAELLLAFIPLL